MQADIRNTHSNSKGARVALAPFLLSCPEVITLGIRPGLDDYSEDERRLLHAADLIFFPTPRFADIFAASGKPTFPNSTTYHYRRSRTLQQLLFGYSKTPHPRTRIYFGREQQTRILDDFTLPVLAMGPRNVPNTTSLIHTCGELKAFARHHHAVIIQEALEWKQRIHLVCVGLECVGMLHAARDRSGTSFHEILHGDRRDLKDPFDMTLHLVHKAALQDVLIEWGYANDRWQALGITHPPVRWKSHDGLVYRHHLIGRLIRSGLL